MIQTTHVVMPVILAAEITKEVIDTTSNLPVKLQQISGAREYMKVFPNGKEEPVYYSDFVIVHVENLDYIPVGWQFKDDGKWYVAKTEFTSEHCANTIDMSYPVRLTYAKKEIK